MPFELLELQEHNSELLKLLTENLPDMLWVKDLNGKYVYANQAICDGLLMAKDTKEPIGQGDVFFALREREAHSDKPHWHTFGELCFNSDQTVIDSGEAMKFEEYGNVKGELLYLEVFKAPFYDKDKNIIGTVGSGRDITKIKKIQIELERTLKTLDKQRKELEYQANHDSLTSLPNRILFTDRLNQAIKLAKRNDTKTALAYIDLDHFKEINDSLGHHVGDKILIEFTKRLKQKIRHSDTISRLTGDEFAIIINDVNNVDDILKFIEELMRIAEDPFTIDKHTLHVAMSLGVSVYPDDGDEESILLKNADAAMNEAKNNGRNTYSFYDTAMTEKAFQRVFLKTALKKAIKNDELHVFFQPQMDAKLNTLVGMEALVRWQHPTMGLITPDKFIPLAEDTGMIVELDRVVMKKALTQFKKWKQAELNPGKLAINLAVKQLESDDFIYFLKDLLNNEKCAYKNIEFEVTESQIMKNPEKSIKVLEEISDLGISIAVDDFGTGYSSLAYLKRLPINKLKIDKSFINDLPGDSEDAAITKTIISLCDSLNLKVIAEGVETVEQKDFVLHNGCKFIQGFLYSKPLEIEKMTELLESYK